MSLPRIAGLLLAVVAAPLLGVAVLAGGAQAQPAGTAPPCATRGPLPGLDGEQAGNARLIAAVTQVVVAGADPAWVRPAAVVSLMAAYQESGLRDLANPTVPGSAEQPGASGSGADHDSVGLFQQRGSWGSVAQRMDPTWATTAFLHRLLTVPGWRSLPPGTAAQAVQRSAYPDAYDRWQDDAQTWLDTIDDGGAGGCGGSGLPAGGTTRLPAGFTLPPGTTSAAAVAVTFALAQIGKPYVYGAAGPDAYDCSGLTMAAWASAGVQLPHNAAAQSRFGTPVGDVSLLQPGDLVFIPGSDGTVEDPGHVGMYVGRGLIVEAPQTGQVIKLLPVTAFTPIAAIRHYGP